MPTCVHHVGHLAVVFAIHCHSRADQQVEVKRFGEVGEGRTIGEDGSVDERFGTIDAFYAFEMENKSIPPGHDLADLAGTEAGNKDLIDGGDGTRLARPQRIEIEPTGQLKRLTELS